jgi:putative endonuclease
MLRCSDGTLYTGIAIDLDKRLNEHNSSEKGAKYTKARRPVKMVYSELSKNKSAALKREIAIKKMTKLQKESIVANYI